MLAAIQSISLRQFRIFLVGTGLVITAIAVAAMLLPTAKAYKSARNAVVVLEEAAQGNTDLDRHLQERHATIESLKFQIHGDMANLPIKQVEAYVIGRLQKISWHNNIELLSVAPASGERTDIFQEMLFNIQLVGEYNDLYRWLWEAKNELGFVVVKEYGLNRRDKSQGRRDCRRTAARHRNRLLHHRAIG